MNNKIDPAVAAWHEEQEARYQLLKKKFPDLKKNDCSVIGSYTYTFDGVDYHFQHIYSYQTERHGLSSVNHKSPIRWEIYSLVQLGEYLVHEKDLREKELPPLPQLPDLRYEETPSLWASIKKEIFGIHD